MTLYGTFWCNIEDYFGGDSTSSQGIERLSNSENMKISTEKDNVTKRIINSFNPLSQDIGPINHPSKKQQDKEELLNHLNEETNSIRNSILRDMGM